MELITQFERNLKTFGVSSGSPKVLLAVSGGMDSVVLTELSQRAGLSFAIAHCNFQLRGDESKRDEFFVKSLAEKYRADFYVSRFETNNFAVENKLSIQEAARKLRYNFFQKLVEEKNFQCTLMAHHADDQVETILLNFFRGTGLEGLIGMPVVNKDQAKTLRPMLNIRREEIAAFAEKNNLHWVEDSSNDESKYTRNFFRNELLPQLKNIFPQVKESVLANAQRLQQTKFLYQTLTDDLIKKISVEKGNELHIPVRKLQQYEKTSLLYEIIKRYGFGEKQVSQVNKLLTAETGKYLSNGNYQIIKHRLWVIISPVNASAGTVLVKDEQSVVKFDGRELHSTSINVQDFHLNKSSGIAQVDAGEVKWPLILRKWRQGDYFYPLGMKKKKKLSRFFIDQKLSKSDKENVWVIESNRKILWVVGYRIDERFKITEKTKQVLSLTVSNL